MIFDKCPFKENGKIWNFLVWFCGVLIYLWGLIPRRTNSCEVSDPVEQDPAGYHTPRNQVLQGIRPCRTMTKMCIFYSRRLFCWVWYPAEQCPTGPDTPQNKVLWGIRPRGTKFYGVSHTGEQLQKWKFQRIRNRIQKYFRVWIWGLCGVDSWKKLEVENLVQLSL